MVYLQDGWFISWNPIQSYLEVSIQSDDRNHFIGWGIQLYGGFLKWAYPQYGWIRVEHAKIYHGWWLGLALFQETPTWDQMFPEMELHGERLRKSDFVHYFLVVLSVKNCGYTYFVRKKWGCDIEISGDQKVKYRDFEDEMDISSCAWFHGIHFKART